MASREGATAAPLLVLSFVTPGCRACAYASRAFARLAREFSRRDDGSAGAPAHLADADHRAGSTVGREVTFLTIDISQRRNQSLGIRLGVHAVPAFHTYALLPSRSPRHSMDPDSFAVLDQRVGPRVVENVRKRLLHFVSPEFNLDDYVFDES